MNADPDTDAARAASDEVVAQLDIDARRCHTPEPAPGDDDEDEEEDNDRGSSGGNIDPDDNEGYDDDDEDEDDETLWTSGFSHVTADGLR
jgi:hypothetical protein